MSTTLSHSLSTQRIQEGDMFVDASLHHFIESQLLPACGVERSHFWQGFNQIVADLAPKNHALLEERERIQTALDAWHSAHPGPISDTQSYREYLEKIGYLVPEPKEVAVTTSNVDSELSEQAGPQLVVPILNARYALNAANARWGSLYDALYGTDVLSESDGAERGKAYNPIRGAKVVAYAKSFLDQVVPLDSASHADASVYFVEDGRLRVAVKGGRVVGLKTPEHFVGYNGNPQGVDSVLLQQNGSHIEIVVNRATSIGQADTAGVSDVILEAALSTILDLEDSVAAVDAADKVLAYRNWLGILQGTLTETVKKGDTSFVRGLNQDRHYLNPQGQPFSLPGRSLLFVRNVGHLMTNPAILVGETKAEIPEGIMDAVITTTIALVDLQGKGANGMRNSRLGSVYIVKPKMHGPAEVAFADALFSRVEAMLGLAPSTVKLGIMDEERRTSINLKACIAAAQSRVAFINTGFLDRTGDEIHTAMLAGPMLRKGDMKTSSWIQAYERNNVVVGLACGLKGRAQIGKGMWAAPDLMAEMLKQKIAHPQSGATTAWVPSPTAATLHAMHYHFVSVKEIQNELINRDLHSERPALLQGLLSIPVTHDTWSDEEKQQELDNNVQGILGYVVRWIDQGIGCSKVPDIHNVGLMEDRATLRISSQHIANWLHHRVVTEEQVRRTFEKMAAVVDAQNAGDPTYIKMARNPTSKAYQAALDLVFKGKEQPSGYTEPLLHAWRLKLKQEG